MDERVTPITAAELRQLLDAEPEAEILLVDVREPEEYAQAHLPGAQLFPLMMLTVTPQELRPATHTVFYCRSGRRSLRAAMQISRQLDLPNVYNLTGGILAWDGHAVPDMPNLRLFPGGGSLADHLRRGMELEKGAQRFYEAFAERFRDDPLGPFIARLAAAEEGHAEGLFELLQSLDETLAEARFDEVYAALPDDLLESGTSTEALIERAHTHADLGRLGLLEVALEMELKAYDLYRSLANLAEDEQARATFMDLAEHERFHAESVVGALSRLATGR